MWVWPIKEGLASYNTRSTTHIYMEGIIIIAGNFQGQNIRALTYTTKLIFYPRMKRPCLPLPAVKAEPQKYLPQT